MSIYDVVELLAGGINTSRLQDEDLLTIRCSSTEAMRATADRIWRHYRAGGGAEWTMIATTHPERTMFFERVADGRWRMSYCIEILGTIGGQSE